MQSQSELAAAGLSWQLLLDYIEGLTMRLKTSEDDIDRYKEEMLDRLRKYKSNKQDYEKFVAFDERFFTKNLVAEFDDTCNIIVFCWAPKQQSSIHSHSGSRCHVKILQGQLTELQFARPNDANPTVHVDLSKKMGVKLCTDDVTYIDDSIGAHLVTNKSNTEPAISLHVYWPPYRTTRVYTPSEDQNGIKLSNEQSKDIELEFYNRPIFN